MVVEGVNVGMDKYLCLVLGKEDGCRESDGRELVFIK